MGVKEGSVRVDTWMSAEEAEQLRRAAYQLGWSMAEVIRVGARVLGNALIEAVPSPAAPMCIVCGTPRHPNHPNPLFDSMAHAQCDQITANLERSLRS